MNGVLFKEVGKVSQLKEGSKPLTKIQYIQIKNDKVEELELILHVSNFHSTRFGVARVPWIGNGHSISGKFQAVLMENYFFLGTFLVLSLYHLGLFFLRRTDLSTLYFGCFSLLLGIRPLVTNRTIMDNFPFLHWELLFKLEYLTISLTPSIFVLFFQALFPKELSRKISLSIFLFSLFLTGIIVLGYPYFLSSILTYIQIFALFCAFISLWILIRAVSKKLFGAVPLLLGTVLFVLTVMNDILHQKDIIYTGYFLSYGLFVFIFSQAYLLSVRFSNAFKESEEQRKLLTQAKVEIETLSRTKDEFLANLSHEIKTPLSVVYTYSQMLPAQKENPKKIEKYAGQIYTNASKLNDYVSDLLLVTDIESNLELLKSEVQWKELLQKSLSPFNGLLEEKSLTLEISDFPETSLNCDPTLLKKAIQAVIKNAIVYNKTNGKINISTKLNQGFINLYITDTGIGIVEEMKERIFDKFLVLNEQR